MKQYIWDVCLVEVLRDIKVVRCIAVSNRVNGALAPLMNRCDFTFFCSK